MKRVRRNFRRGVKGQYELLEPRRVLAASPVADVANFGAARDFGESRPDAIVSYFNLDDDADQEFEVRFGHGTNSAGGVGAKDRILVGNWDGSGVDRLGAVRSLPTGQLQWFLNTDGDAGDERRFYFGLTGDLTFAADMNGDGLDDAIAVRPTGPPIPGQARLMTWYISYGPFPESPSELTAPVSRTDVFGTEGDLLVPGDWDGDGDDDVGSVSTRIAPGFFIWYTPQNIGGTLYGLSTDIPISGNWDGVGGDNFGVIREGSQPNSLSHWLLQLDNDPDAEIDFGYGLKGDQYFVGNWGSPPAAEIEIDGVSDGGTSALGSTPQGGNLQRSYTIRNLGNAELSLATPSLSGPFELIGSLPATIPIGGTAEFTLRVDTTSAGAKNGTFSLGNNDSDEAPYNFSLVADVQTVTFPEIQIDGLTDGAVYSFGTAQQNARLQATFTLRNIGNASLSLGTPTVSGPFAIASVFPSSVAAGESTTFTMSVNTASDGFKQGALSFSNNDTDENPFDIALSAIVLPTSIFNSRDGYGLIDVNAAVSTALGVARFPDAPEYGTASRDWNLNQTNIPDVWSRGYVGQGVLVAVVDSGLQAQHPEFSGTVFVNPREVPGNQIDDDGNGFIDDISGWDFVEDDNSPQDGNGHGTHVAGTIAAARNGVGTTGGAYGARILPVRVLGNSGSGNLFDLVAGIRYAANLGAKVINVSIKLEVDVPDLRDAVEFAHNQGALVVMSASNDADPQPDFPARYATSFGIAVGAIDRLGNMASFSNRAGSNRINYVVAPGVSIESTHLANGYRLMSGTSMAAPHVAAAAALVLSAVPTLSPANLASILYSTASRTSLTGTSAEPDPAAPLLEAVVFRPNGDFNGDGVINVRDVDDFALAIRRQSAPAAWDLNDDGKVDLVDRNFLAYQQLGLRPGNFDNDLDVDSADVLVFLSGWTGTQDPANGTAGILSGDIDGDGDVDSQDLLDLIANWTGAQNSRTSLVGKSEAQDTEVS